MYAEELLYNLTEVTESNKKEILRLTGLEFWGQVKTVDMPGSVEVIAPNKKYVYGIIDTSRITEDFPAGSPVDLADITEVTPHKEENLIDSCSGVTLFDIPARGKALKYGCLFEKLNEPAIMGMPSMELEPGQKACFVADYTGGDETGLILKWETLPPLPTLSVGEKSFLIAEYDADRKRVVIRWTDPA